MSFDVHLVLDIDGTLVGTADAEPRPFVDLFLRWAFARFASVSLWTAGNRVHANAIVARLQPPGRRFAVVWVDDDTDMTYVVGRRRGPSVAVRKPLRRLCASLDAFRVGIRPDNTVVVEDTLDTCAANLDNAVAVPSFSGRLAMTHDTTLLSLRHYLCRYLLTDTDVRRPRPSFLAFLART
jgi:hypothetical protein